MSGALEAKLVITAEDRTKAAFDAILAKLDKVFERAIGIDRAARTAERAIASTDAAIERVGRALVAGAQNMDQAARAMDHAAAAIKAGATAAERVARIPRPEASRHGFGGGHAVPHVVSTLPSDHGFRRVAAGGGFAMGGSEVPSRESRRTRAASLSLKRAQIVSTSAFAKTFPGCHPRTGRMRSAGQPSWRPNIHKSTKRPSCTR